MKISKCFPILLLAGAALAVWAAEDTEFESWMKTTGTAVDNLKKMEPKSGEKAVRAAERIGGAYEDMIGFWRQRNAADAVKWSEQGKADALELATALYAGDQARTTAALNDLGTTCRQCHEKYREKVGEGKYRIK